MIVDNISGRAKPRLKAEHSISNQNWVEAEQVHAGFSIRHDGTSIFLFYQVEEPQVRALNTDFNSSVWEDSCVEFFLSFVGDDNYYNFEINAIGTILGGYGPDRHQRYRLSETILSKVLTVPSLGRNPISNLDQHTSWTMQVTIPIDVLVYSDLDTLSGKDAHANFYKCGDKLRHPHFLSWKPVLTPKPDFHQAHYFGQLSFL